VAVESILGLKVSEGRELVLKPCISAAWPKCRVKYRLPDGEHYDISIENPAGRETGLRQAWLDGKPVAVENGTARVPLLRDGDSHAIRIVL
jgi:cyclic beta-1,2-glucan synthetase